MVQKQALGQRIHSVLITQGSQAAAAFAEQEGHPDLFQRVHAVASEEPSPSFLHSALCAMSLPVKRPVNDQLPIIRQDGQYTLVITPKSVLRSQDGRQHLTSLGVPFGSLPRLILIHVMTEAVRKQSRHIVLGATFSEWMRSMGFRTVSYGPRGSATLIRQQLDRLLACEWMIRWDLEHLGKQQEFGVKEIKLTNEYTGVDGASGTFMRELILTPAFFEHLREHAVPLNEHAIRQLRDSATALDLYSWLAYRLPRLTAKRSATLSWSQLAVHFGNSGANVRKFRQTIRDAWERQVSAVYPEARADFETTVIRLHHSPAPLQRRLVPGTRLALVNEKAAPPAIRVSGDGEVGSLEETFHAHLLKEVGAVQLKVWLGDARLGRSSSGEFELVVDSASKASWIRANMDLQIGRAATAAGLSGKVRVTCRKAAASSEGSR
jgi:hypothetical protein